MSMDYIPHAEPEFKAFAVNFNAKECVVGVGKLK
jgi:hypothetical protein